MHSNFTLTQPLIKRQINTISNNHSTGRDHLVSDVRCVVMTSVICHPDYRDVTMPCRSGARLTLDVTSHIPIKMSRVVTADPGVTCPAVHG